MKLNYNKAEFASSYGKFSQIPPPERIEIAFAGHSNVGKSTLINKLFNRKNLARVSSVPGKTATPVGILREIWMIFYSKQYDKKINQIRQLYDILRSWSCLFIL